MHDKLDTLYNKGSLLSNYTADYTSFIYNNCKNKTKQKKTRVNGTCNYEKYTGSLKMFIKVSPSQHLLSAFFILIESKPEIQSAVKKFHAFLAYFFKYFSS